MPEMPPTVLHVVFSLEPGGMENGVVNVAQRVDPAELGIHVCCLERGGEFVRRLPASAQVTVLGKRPGYSLLTVFRLAGLFRRTSPALIHTHNFGPLFYAHVARMLTPAYPVLHGEHGMMSEIENRRHYLWLRRFLYRRCARVHTVSHSLRQHYIDHGFPEGMIDTVVNGVDTARFRPGPRDVARRECGLPLDAVVLSMIGSLQRRKRHREVIQAFERLAPRFPQAHLLLVGSGGPEARNVQAQIAASPVAGRMHLTGFQNDPLAYYRASDLLILASVNEGLSNAALEAMACGVPVIAGSACGNSEIITAGLDGFVVPMNTVDEIADGLSQAIASAGRLPEMGREAVEKAQHGFSIDTMVRNYLALYRRVVALDSRRKPRAAALTGKTTRN